MGDFDSEEDIRRKNIEGAMKAIRKGLDEFFSNVEHEWIDEDRPDLPSEEQQAYRKTFRFVKSYVGSSLKQKAMDTISMHAARYVSVSDTLQFLEYDGEKVDKEKEEIAQKSNACLDTLVEILTEIKEPLEKLPEPVSSEFFSAIDFIFAEGRELPYTRFIEQEDKLPEKLDFIKKTAIFCGTTAYQTDPNFAKAVHLILTNSKLRKIINYMKKEEAKEERMPLEEIIELAKLELPSNYNPLRKLGSGRVSDVYLAQNKYSGEVAVKIVNQDVPIDAVVRNIEKLRELRHPNIVTYYDPFEMEGKFVLPMEPFEQTLKEKLENSGSRIKFSDAMLYFEQMLTALAACHERGIMHYDLAPHNVGIDKDGVKLTDFNDAIYDTKEIWKHWPIDYASPRMLKLSRNKTAYDVVPRDNLWSLGVILYEMLTGNKFFSSKEIDKVKEPDQYMTFMIDQQQKLLNNVREGIEGVIKNPLANVVKAIDFNPKECAEYFEKEQLKIDTETKNKLNLFYQHNFFNTLKDAALIDGAQSIIEFIMSNCFFDNSFFGGKDARDIESPYNYRVAQTIQTLQNSYELRKTDIGKNG